MIYQQAALQQTLQQRSADLAAVKQALVEESADKKIVAEELERKKVCYSRVCN